ncbi:MAG TPA: DUF3025 domain-containing protein [Usitatibacter sp.]|nr:DUF3025 domain-containing protein [Usitatibacter sp.]
MDWPEARERLRGPIFAPLAPGLARLPADRWPTHEELTAAAAGVETQRGKAVRFVPPRGRGEGRGYELHIDETGEVQTRARNWHDLFNALAWIAFPRAKARINAQHAAILAGGGEGEARHRGPERDALTLFDEGGVIVASSSPALLRLIVDFEWKELFWHRRAELETRMRFFAFGHALHEKALEPYLGIVAKTVFVPVDELFFMLPPEAQVARADELAAAHFAARARFPSPRVMAPLPALGIPGWHPGTVHEGFYDDERHFRGKPGGADGAA